MNPFVAWLQKKLTALLKRLSPPASPILSSPKVAEYNKEFYFNYFSLIASGVRLKLVEAMFRLDLFSFFAENNPVLEQEIIATLGLVPLRAKKWLHLLCCEHFLEKVSINNQPAYRLPQPFYNILHSESWWGMQFFYNKWGKTASYDLVEILQDEKAKLTPWSWPPNSKEQAEWLETWMTQTSRLTIECILDHIDFNQIQFFLDVGGGDGTMACNFVTAYPHLKATVYNLPYSIDLAQENIASRDLSQSIRLYEGNFLQDDALPGGHDLILFSRVLMDWGVETSKKLLKMAYEALEKGGLVAICELFMDKNHDTCLSCEYGYIFYDDIDVYVMKSIKKYRLMLAEIGFTIIRPTLTPRSAHPFCSLILARK